MHISKEIIVESKKMDFEKYNKFLENKYHSCFQTVEWLLLINFIREDLNLKFFILCDENDNWMAIMPYYEKRYFFNTFMSLPYGAYGGFIYDKSNLLIIKKFLMKSKINNMIGGISSFDKNLYSDFLIEYKKHTTWIVNCKQTYEEFFKKIGSKTRNQIRKSEKSGIEYLEIKDETEVLGCIKLYENLVAKHKIKKPFPNILFYKLLEISGEHIKFIIAKKSKLIIAYAVFLETKEEVFYWLSAYNSEFSSDNAPLGILSYVLRSCFNDKTINQLNLGAVPLDNVGLMKFKESIAAVETDYSMYSTSMYVKIQKFIDKL